MGELEERINSILNDPGQLQQITRLARSFMGEGESGGEAGKPAAPAAPEDMLKGMSGFLRTMQGSGQSNCGRLLEAMKPYLNPKRREKMDRAMKLAQMARLAELAMNGVVNENEALSGEQRQNDPDP